jgi:hypothetical protein
MSEIEAPDALVQQEDPTGTRDNVGSPDDAEEADRYKACPSPSEPSADQPSLPPPPPQAVAAARCDLSFVSRCTVGEDQPGRTLPLSAACQPREAAAAPPGFSRRRLRRRWEGRARRGSREKDCRGRPGAAWCHQARVTRRREEGYGGIFPFDDHQEC